MDGGCVRWVCPFLEEGVIWLLRCSLKGGYRDQNLRDREGNTSLGGKINL